VEDPPSRWIGRRPVAGARNVENAGFDLRRVEAAQDFADERRRADQGVDAQAGELLDRRDQRGDVGGRQAKGQNTVLDSDRHHAVIVRQAARYPIDGRPREQVRGEAGLEGLEILLEEQVQRRRGGQPHLQ